MLLPPPVCLDAASDTLRFTRAPMLGASRLLVDGPPGPRDALPIEPARPREDPLPGNGFGGVRELDSGPAASPREKNESVFVLELLLVDETELDREGNPPTADQDALEVGESTAESNPPGG